MKIEEADVFVLGDNDFVGEVKYKGEPEIQTIELEADKATEALEEFCEKVDVEHREIVPVLTDKRNEDQ